MGVPVFVVDAFTPEAFAGNPAGVCLLRRPADVAWMQAVARELSHSETAFLFRRAEGYSLRWFTPTVEVDLCGHATLASAHVLWEEGRIPRTRPARFFTRSGVLTALRRRGEIELDFPVEPPRRAVPPRVLRQALGVPFRFVGRNRFDYLVEVRSPAQVASLRPDLHRLATVPVRGTIVTSAADADGVDFVCRFFAPRAGVPEDPVTGSAFCALAPYWSQKLGKTALVGRQLSSRGGSARVEIESGRVKIRGRAVTVLRGDLAV